MTTWIPRAVVGTFVLALAACSRPSPPPVVTAAPEPPPAPPPLVQRPAHQVLRTHWSFESKPDQCTAVAAAGRVALQVSVRPASAVRLVVTLGASAVPRHGGKLHFIGPTGYWQVPGRPSGKRQIEGDLGGDDTALSRVLVLLNGGVLELGDPKEALPALNIPAGGTPGQAWFDCVRRQAA